MINEGTNDRCKIIDHSRDAATLDISAISVGNVFSIEHRFVSDDVDDFAKLCGDFSSLHVDEIYASATEFGGRIVHGPDYEMNDRCR